MFFNRNIITSTALVTSFALGVGGAGVIGSSIIATDAIAEPVRIEGQSQLPSFSTVVGAVSPAVVSVRVEGIATPAAVRSSGQSSGRGSDDIPEQFKGTPFEKFFGERFGSRQNPQLGRKRAPAPRSSQGSGFFISSDGYLVTNHHVVANGSKFSIQMSDGQSFDAQLIGTDERTDLAVLKVEADTEFTYVDFASEQSAQVGDWVVAVGNPFGLGGTVTAGIVSARGRDIGAGPYDDFLQIDAAVNRGNSGGPTFNLQGEVVGVNTAIYSPSGGNVGIAFAIPASTTKEVVADIINNGSVQRGWLGVQIRPVTGDIADAVGLADPSGAIIAQTTQNGPASKAGLKSGDIVLSVDGEQIDDPKDLANTIAKIEPGAKAKLQLWRNGKSENLAVKLGELPNSPKVLASLNSPSADKEPLADMGLLIEQNDEGEITIKQVAPNSLAAQKGFRQQDVIEKINGLSVTSPAAIDNAMKEARKNGRNSSLFQLRNQNGTRFSTLPVKEAG